MTGLMARATIGAALFVDFAVLGSGVNFLAALLALQAALLAALLALQGVNFLAVLLALHARCFTCFTCFTSRRQLSGCFTCFASTKVESLTQKTSKSAGIDVMKEKKLKLITRRV